MGTMLILIGVTVALLGAIVHFSGRSGLFGRLPGDISMHVGNTHIYFPVVTCILLSIVLSVVMNLFWRR